MNKFLKQLKRILSYGRYGASGNLVGGSALVLEDLDLQNVGLYSQEQKDKLVADGAPEEDFFPAHEPPKMMGKYGYGYWARRSDEGVKWRIFRDTELKLHKTSVKKD